MKDGAHVIYRIQHQNQDDDRMVEKEEWDYSNFDHFGIAPNILWTPLIGGETGFSEPEDAEAAIKWLRKEWPEYRFRVVLQFLAQRTIVLEEGFVSNSKEE